jgi:hypothetical protein
MAVTTDTFPKIALKVGGGKMAKSNSKPVKTPKGAPPWMKGGKAMPKGKGCK